MKKYFTAHVIFAASALATQQAWALGFGRAVSDAVLGQAFTFTVPVNVDAGEHFGPECLATQVYYGESLLPPTVVRTEMERGATEGAWIVRITASTPVQEPIVEVALNTGCERRFTRRFSVFADPPNLGATPALVAPPPAAATPPVAVPASAATPTAFGLAYAAQRGASAPAGGHARVVRKGPTMALANELNAPPAPRRPAVDNGIAHKSAPRASAAAPVDTSRLVLDAGVAHLKLDMEEPIIPPPPAASGPAPGLAEIDDADTRQLKALQQSLDAARHDTDAQRAAAAKLQAELARAQSRDDWTPWLLGLLAIAAAAIAALAWKLRQQNRIAHSDWFNQSQLGPATVLPPSEGSADAASASGLPDVPATPTATEELLPEQPLLDESDARGAPAMVDPSATRPLDRHAMAAVLQADAAPRELSVEELLDLEQQADFFIALGQEDAAVDLLMSHLRSAGGQSPLPYTKLLEIYRRQGDRSAYERTRARFNRRFNAYAPDWDTGPSAGRLLEDYPETVALLENAWRSPIDAMALLESLLFKRDDTSELFDLPAYRDVLVLYSLARDLWQHGGGQGGAPIDVLLPLDETGRSAPAYASAREINDRALPDHDDGLDLESVDVEGDTRNGLLTRFEMTGYDPAPSGGGHVDLELPAGDVHVTLDELSLAPVAPTRPKPAPEWRDPDGPDAEPPTKR